MEYSVYFADKIANNILRGDRQYIHKITKKKEKLFYEDAVENNDLSLDNIAEIPLSDSIEAAAITTCKETIRFWQSFSQYSLVIYLELL